MYYNPLFQTRREMLQHTAGGFGTVALSVLLNESLFAAQHSLATKMPHVNPRAKNVIFLFMDGGVSHVDTFDPKPRLSKEHG